MLRVEKGKVVKNSRVEVLWVFMDPPHWVLIAMKGGKEEEGGWGDWCCNSKRRGRE